MTIKPYHGLVQLIALSNGNNVGTGVSGRQASEYLDNVGASKVKATNDILKSIKKNGPSFVLCKDGRQRKKSHIQKTTTLMG